jgi:ABC-2 type transport system ATP-binding protein
MCGLRGERLRERLAECLRISGLEPRADERVDKYSGGMKRRANFVAALMAEPAILILDEPTVGIDAQSRRVILDSLRDLNRRAMTLLYATHYMEEAQEMCSRVAILDSGKVVKIGPPAQLISEQPGCRSLDQVFLKLTGRSLRD